VACALCICIPTALKINLLAYDICCSLGVLFHFKIKQMVPLTPIQVGLLSILLTFVTAAGAIACGICASRHSAKSGISGDRKPLWLSSISTFSGGVLLSAALTHLLNDTVESEALQELS
jgi:hypothetical protein